MSEDGETRSPHSSGAQWALAGASLETAEAYLKAQTRLALLQAEDLEREDAVRHWSLRIHHVSAVLKLGLELAAAVVVLVIAFFVVGAVWSAAHDKNLVIEAFDVPADMAANGLSGQVVAKQIQDRLAWMQANTDTIRQASAYENNFSNDIKVQIPDTGVSIGEFYRYLANALGHQTHISGEVWRTAEGVSLSVRSGGGAAHVFGGNARDLSSLVAKAAEQIYWQTQPYRYAVFLGEHGRLAEATVVEKRLVAEGSADDKAWAYSRLGLDAMTEGKEREAVALQKASIAINPDLPHVWGNLGSAETYFGHDETVFQSARRSFALFGNLKTASQLAGYAVAAGLLGSKTIMSDLLGNYREAIAAEKKMRLMASYAGSGLGSQVAMRDDLILGHDVPLPPYRLAALRAADAQTLQDFSSGRITLNAPPLAAYDFAAAEGDWLAARNAIETDLKYPAMKAPALAPLIPVWFRPRLALADMKSGDIVAAQLLIDKTPRDCYLCVRVRGQIAAAQKRWRQADRWFAAAVHQVPSLPFAEHDWGVALMAKGDRTGAIAKFESAHKKGPHFADPLEMWGEVLMLQNRSDLALAKFAEAAQVAPNWSRLHLKWGEALTYAGNKAAAKKQFALAAHLFMTPSEKTELQRFATR